MYVILHYPYTPRSQHASHCHWSHTYPLSTSGDYFFHFRLTMSQET